jgi:molecular chaperone HscB
LDIRANDFELFGLKTQFSQVRAELDQRWKDLQRQAHPDRFAAQGDSAQRLAMQWSVRINEAYQRLKDPQKRAAYLCELAGYPIGAENNTAMPSSFLMQQMQWREDLEEASSPDQLDKLSDEIRAAKNEALQALAQSLDQAQNYPNAVILVRSLMFFERLLSEINAKLDQA